MKNYFPHDSDARSDDKIIALRIKHKWEGYGLYWALIEKLRESKNYTLKADYNVLAFDLRADAAILKSVINDFGLFAFTNNGECFYSESLTYIIHSGFISGYQNRYGDNLKPPTNVYHRMTA